MPASYTQIVLHTVWSTKYRNPWVELAMETDLHSIIADQFVKKGSIVLAIGGASDHVHVLHTLPRTVTIAELVRVGKAVSSKWMHRQHERYEQFGWQDGYGSFSADYRNLGDLIRYIKTQRQHHAGTDPDPGQTFVNEYTKILKTYGHADFDREYVFPDPPKIS